MRPDLLAAELRGEAGAVEETAAFLLAEAGVTRQQWLEAGVAVFEHAGLPVPSWVRLAVAR